MAGEVTLNSRQQILLKIINEKKYVSIKELKKDIDVSEATVRRDLDEMSAMGVIGRVHGGAIELTSTSHEPVQTVKMGLMTEEKKRIAEYVATLVRPGNSIFLDSGTTTLYIAEAIKDIENLTIVTDNLDVASRVPFNSTSTVIFTGGMIRRDYSVVVGPMTEEAISRFKVDMTFIGCDAIDPDSGLYNVNYLEVGTKKAMMRCGRKTMLVADHTKIGNCSFAFVAPFDEIDAIITDTGLSPAILAKLKKNKVDVVLC